MQTGVVVEIESNLRPRKYPDFMQKKHKAVYQSQVNNHDLSSEKCKLANAAMACYLSNTSVFPPNTDTAIRQPIYMFCPFGKLPGLTFASQTLASPPYMDHLLACCMHSSITCCTENVNSNHLAHMLSLLKTPSGCRPSLASSSVRS